MVRYSNEVLAIIPARGGSKGIPHKNIKLFAGAPLIAYSIAAAKQSALVTRVIASTDDPEIAKVACEWGAETSFLRPAELAQDDTTDFPVFKHALDWLQEHEGNLPEIIIQLRPTSPVRPVGLVDQAIQILLDHPEADSVRGVVPSGQNPYKTWRIDLQSGQLRQLLTVEGINEPYNAPRQVLPNTYWQTGHIDAIRTRTIFEKNSLSGDVVMPVLVDPRYTVDIDVPSDWLKYEKLMQDANLDPVDPLGGRRKFPARVSALVMDFDGVLTDDKVSIDQDGRESVRCSRSDGFGLTMLRDQGLTQLFILSREENPVVSARGNKLGIEVFQAVMDKATGLNALISQRGLNPDEVIFVGNDLPDLAVLPIAGYFVCPSDARSEVLRQADLVLTHPGGKGAIRELTDLIFQHNLTYTQE
ncbi:MAG: acylneuraminate cytidylyltransferase [Anaerolineaceae bacterium]